MINPANFSVEIYVFKNLWFDHTFTKKFFSPPPFFFLNSHFYPVFFPTQLSSGTSGAHTAMVMIEDDGWNASPN